MGAGEVRVEPQVSNIGGRLAHHLLFYLCKPVICCEHINHHYGKHNINEDDNHLYLNLCNYKKSHKWYKRSHAPCISLSCHEFKLLILQFHCYQEGYSSLINLLPQDWLKVGESQILTQTKQTVETNSKSLVETFLDKLNSATITFNII